MALYVTYLYHQCNLKVSSIPSQLSAITYFHSLSGYNNPAGSFLIIQLLLSYEKHDAPPRTRKSTTKPILQKLVKSIKAYLYEPYVQSMYIALFTLMYHALLRCSEVSSNQNHSHNLKSNQIRLSKGHLKIFFQSFKHSKRPPPPVYVSATHDVTCPVKACRAYLKFRSKESGPLFRWLNHKALAHNQIVKCLKLHLTLTGFKPIDFNTHSFRIGKTTDMAKQGYSYSLIALAGRWLSNAYLKYIQPSSVTIC